MCLVLGGFKLDCFAIFNRASLDGGSYLPVSVVLENNVIINRRTDHAELMLSRSVGWKLFVT